MATLVAHGDAAARARLCRLLSEGGTAVVSAASAAEALGQLHTTPPDLVVGDLFDADGAQPRLVQQLRRDLAIGGIAVVLLARSDALPAARRLAWSGWHVSDADDDDAIRASAARARDPGMRPPGLAHELNNLLTGMIGYAELLAGRVAHDPVARADLDRLLSAGHRAAVITGTFLTRNRPEPPAGLASLGAVATPAEAVTPRGTILVVDDDRAVRIAVGQPLRRAGYRVTEASTLEDAAAIVAAQGPALRLVIAGAKLLRASRSGSDGLSGSVRVLLLTEGAEPGPDVALPALAWPFTSDDLLRAVGRLIGSSSAVE